MLDARCKVMIVEDAVENQQVLENLLESDYDLSVAESAESCLELLPGDRPDLILLDIGLPGMDGFEVCRLVKSNSDTWNIPVIFVSSRSSTEERLAGYEAGGDDYVTKPVAPDELITKVERSLLAKQEEALLKEIINENREAAMQTVISAGELAGLNLFMQQSGSSMSYEELAESFMHGMRSFGLQVSLMLRTELETYFVGCGQDSLESTIFKKSKNEGRFVEFQSRTMVNAGGCSVLIKNLPVTDPERCDQLREYVAVMADAVAVRIETLQELLNENAQRKTTLRHLARTSNKQFLNIRDKLNVREIRERSIVLSMRQELKDSLTALDLGEQEQQDLVQKIDGSIRQFNELPDVGRDIEASFKTTREILSRLLDQN